MVDPVLSSPKEMRAFSMAWPREGYKIVWDMHKLYTAMSLTTYNRQASKWAHDNFIKWVQDLELHKLVGLEHILPSVYVHTAKEWNAEPSRYFLPVQGITSAGLVILVFQWAWNTVKQGGLRSTGPEKAKSLTKILLHSICSSKPFDLKICFRDSVTFHPLLANDVMPDCLLKVESRVNYTLFGPVRLRTGRSGPAKAARFLGAFVSKCLALKPHPRPDQSKLVGHFTCGNPWCRSARPALRSAELVRLVLPIPVRIKVLRGSPSHPG